MYRILTIDGGGIKGVFAASFLATVEEQLGTPIVNYFDLMAGTSTGGIIVLGLGLGKSAGHILSFYESKGPEIFKRRMFSLSREKYSQEGLKKHLEDVFGCQLLGESATRLLIPTLNIDTGKAYIYKTAHHNDFELDYKVKAVNVALSTAAAPLYFKSYVAENGIPFSDGGVYANNPISIAVAEAIGVLGWCRHEINVLSIGTTQEALNIKPQKCEGICYLIRNWPKILPMFLAAQSSLSDGIAGTLLRGNNSIMRINPVVEKGSFSLDGVQAIPRLKGQGHEQARNAMPALRKMFFTEKAIPFEPYHRPNNSANGFTKNGLLNTIST